MKKAIDINILQQKIDAGVSSYDAALSFGVSQTTMIRIAKAHGLHSKANHIGESNASKCKN